MKKKNETTGAFFQKYNMKKTNDFLQLGNIIICYMNSNYMSFTEEFFEFCYFYFCP